MPTIGPDGWTVEFTEAEREELEAAKKAWADAIWAAVPIGGKLIVEASNECGHVDLETGEWITDHYSEERYEIPNRGNVG